MIDKNNKYHEMMVKLDFFPVYFPTGNPKEKKTVMFWRNSKVPYGSQISDKILQKIIKYNTDVLVSKYLGKSLSKTQVLTQPTDCFECIYKKSYLRNIKDETEKTKQVLQS